MVTVVIVTLGPVSDPFCTTYQEAPNNQKPHISVLLNEIFKELLGKKETAEVASLIGEDFCSFQSLTIYPPPMLQHMYPTDIHTNSHTISPVNHVRLTSLLSAQSFHSFVKYSSANLVFAQIFK